MFLLYLYNNLGEDNQIMIMLSARKKYMTEEQKKIINLRKTCVIDRKILSLNNIEKCINDIKKYEIEYGLYKSSNNKSIPQNALTCYITINPISNIKAINTFIKEQLTINEEYLTALKNNKDINCILKRINNPKGRLMSCLQKSIDKKIFIDIDFDINENEIDLFDSFLYELTKNNVEYVSIKTHGGYHVLIKKDTINFNFYKLVKALNKKCSNEIVVNRNAMIPLPGTLQGNKLVTFSRHPFDLI
jgi:ribosome-binding factor A